VEEINPYEPPKSEIVIEKANKILECELARRTTRLGAQILDGLIIGVPTGLLFWGIKSSMGYSYTEEVPGLMGLLINTSSVLTGSLLYLAINFKLLIKQGQTIGKKACNIQIVKEDNTIPTLRDSFLIRHFLFSLAGVIPVVGSFFILIDPLFIFTKKRKCIHDYAAGTKVIIKYL
jgi:uncharacterized RDD family membrane protein YckC